MSRPKKQLEELLADYESPEELLAELSMALIEQRLGEEETPVVEETAPAAAFPRLLA